MYLYIKYPISNDIHQWFCTGLSISIAFNVSFFFFPQGSKISLFKICNLSNITKNNSKNRNTQIPENYKIQNRTCTIWIYFYSVCILVKKKNVLWRYNCSVSELKLGDSRSVFLRWFLICFLFFSRQYSVWEICIYLCRFNLFVLFYANFKYNKYQIKLPFSDNDYYIICFRCLHYFQL